MVIVAVGEIVVDWIATARGANNLDADSFHRCLGGNGTNVAVGICRLGGKARLVGKIGRDLHAEFLRKALSREKIDVSFLIEDERYPTAQCYAFWDRGDDYSYYNWPNPHAADMLQADELHAGMFAGASFMHTTGVSLMVEPRRSAAFRAMEIAHECGILVSYDVCFPPGRQHERTDYALKAMQEGDILKLNYHELCVWSDILAAGTAGVRSDDDICDQDKVARSANVVFEHFQPALLVITLGEFGCLMKTNGNERFSAPFTVDCLAPVGAGDAFIGGMLYALDKRAATSREAISRLTAEDLEDVGVLANAVGALATRTQGACDGLPSMAEVEALRGKR